MFSIINHSLLKAGHFYYTLTCWARKKNKEFFSYFSGKWDLTFQILFYGKNKKNLINLSSAETAHNVVNDNSQMSVRKKKKMCSKMMLFLNNGFITPF